MDDQNRDNFYEGPPIEEQERWHDNAVVAEGEARPGERQPLEGSLDEVDLPEGGFDPQPSLLERPHSSQSGLDQGTLTRDPSHSRAVDRADGGLDPAAAGYDRTNEGPTPGPLEPDADEVPTDAEEIPGGQWGSSG